MISFKDRKILITGATGTIGNALVKKFVSLEGKVLATGTKTEKLETLKKEFPNISVLKFDISEHSKIEEFIENVSSQLAGLDVLVNNAGINMDNLSLRMKDEEWKKVIDVNFLHQPWHPRSLPISMAQNPSLRIKELTKALKHSDCAVDSN